jgi:hypothetical protein
VLTTNIKPLISLPLHVVKELSFLDNYLYQLVLHAATISILLQSMSSPKSIVVAPASPVYTRALWVAEAIVGVVVLMYGYRWIRYRSKIIASQSGDKATQQLMQLLAHNSIIHLAGYTLYYFICE